MKTSIALFTALLLSPFAGLAAAETVKPNIVYHLADDLGWSDISAHPGGSIPTPNIDRLLKQGVELRNFMGWCVCSPRRAMLLTGRHPFRVGTGPETGGELEKAETTIAEGFKAHGYRTGVFGKWHNGEDPDTAEFRAAHAEDASVPGGCHSCRESRWLVTWRETCQIRQPAKNETATGCGSPDHLPFAS